MESAQNMNPDPEVKLIRSYFHSYKAIYILCSS